MENNEHKISIEELYERLGSSARGLAGAQARERRLRFGPNILEEKEKRPVIIWFGRHLVNFFAILLWIGAALAFAAERLSPGGGNLYIGIALSVVVVLNALFTFIQEYESEKIIESFRKMMPLRIEVLRDGARKEALAGEIVPGDIVFLKEGDRVPADGRLIAENALRVDHSSLTGESEPQLRTLQCTHEKILESRNMVFSGTLVQSGDGAALVYGTGMNTQLGGIAKLTKETVTVVSPLRKEINYFIRVISTIAIVLGIIFFALGYLSGNRLMASIIFAIGIIVANVPEGLLPTVSLCLGMASKRMARKKALIKRLESVETLGSTTVICTDKTGTITENRVSVNTVVVGLEERNVHEEGIREMPGMEALLDISVLCNNARLDEKGRAHGDPTEGALLLFAGGLAEAGRIRRASERLKEYPFDSNTKMMVTVNRSEQGTASHLKGAPEVVIEKCDRVLIDGRAVEMSQADRDRIMRYYRRLSSRGERVLGLAYMEGDDVTVNRFVFAALAGMIDPPRKEIPEAVSKCKTAGIKVVMITGDYSLTAEAVARRAGVIGRGRANVMTGGELDRTGDEALREFLKKDDIIFARVSPGNKLRIVKVLQSMGEVVTVTGDGVNDAPALKNADMGVAMGVAGTEVAKEAADMILLDDNFASIVNAIEEGRTAFSNIKKFIAYILTSNVPEIWPFIAFVLLGIPLPLTVVLILSIDLGTDLLPALGLGVETPEVDVMKRPPRPRDERLLTPSLLLMSYGVFGMIQAAAGFFSYFAVLYMGGWGWGQPLAQTDPLYLRAVTAFFSSIVVCQVANVQICRTRTESIFKKGFLSNRLVLLGIFFELALLMNIVYNPYSHALFGTRGLTLLELCLPVPFALMIFFGDEMRKALIRRGNLFVSRYLSW